MLCRGNGLGGPLGRRQEQGYRREGPYGQAHHYFTLPILSLWKTSLVGFWSGKGKTAIAGATSPRPPAAKGFLLSSTLPANRSLTCAWPGLCKQQIHSLQGPGPLQSSKAPSDEEWPATEQDGAQAEEDSVRTIKGLLDLLGPWLLPGPPLNSLSREADSSLQLHSP